MSCAKENGNKKLKHALLPRNMKDFNIFKRKVYEVFQDIIDACYKKCGKINKDII